MEMKTILKQHTSPSYTRFDPAHLFDGLFIPCRGKGRGRLVVAPRKFGQSKISFQGFEQLGADDQSIFLALFAQLSASKTIIKATPSGQISKKLRHAMSLNLDDGSPLASNELHLSSVLDTAGYENSRSGAALNRARVSLNRLRGAQIREIDQETGWDRVCNLIAVEFSQRSDRFHVAVNPRLTGVIFKPHYIKISLVERNALKTEVAKLLHCWLSSNIRPGKSQVNPNGIHIDSLGPHIWGHNQWLESNHQTLYKRRSQLISALREISECNRDIEGAHKWAISLSGNGLVKISRPKKIPIYQDTYQTIS